MARRWWLVALAALGCGTNAPPAGGDRNLPNMLSGPFRLLRADETTLKAPFVLERNAPWEAPSLVDRDGDPATLDAILFVSGGTPSAISRFDVPDGRAADPDRLDVLKASEPWEGPEGVGHPAALRVGPELWLYYASGGCVGRAVSSDGGLSFTKRNEPVLCGQGGPAWEGGAISAPAVYRGFDGQFHLFYEASGAIGEATSSDGVTFQRAGDQPSLAASEASGEGDEPFDSAAVGEPFALLTESPLGRPITLVYYTGHNSKGRTAVGLSARFGDAGPLQRNPAPSLTRHDARGPCVLRFSGVTLLYAAGRSSETAESWKSMIVGAVAPATASLSVVK